METAQLKTFATWARTELITEVSARIAAVLAPASPERTENPNAVRALEDDIAKAGGGQKGRDAVADKVAYTWFNRITSLRFMDANGYTSAGVVSPAMGYEVGQPEVLADAKRGVFDTDAVSAAAIARVTGLLNGTRPSPDPQGEAYSLLLAEYCRYWNKSMPFMFELAGDYTELLIPANLLADGSILARAVATMTPALCRDDGDGKGGVEMIGWLYQFYISERKDEVFAGFKKNKKAGAAEIPAATQLFTPHWIVQYLVENSIGRLWMLNHPESGLVGQMKHYIAPLDEETDFLKVETPEDLTVIDPACGSGHMLTYAFDLLYAIYEEEGYPPSQIPSLILKNNVFGTEIDQRAGSLAAFALTMKARAKQRTFFNKQIEPNICVIEPVVFSQDQLDLLVTPGGNRKAEEAFWNQFEHADTFGSLIRPDAALIEPLRDRIETLDAGTLGGSELREAAETVLKQAEYLGRKYEVAVANPPYMGSKQMNPLLSQFMKKQFPESKSDLFAAFIERCTQFAKPGGAAALITMQSWMFLSSYQKLRSSLLTRQHIASMLHLGTRAFDSIGGEVVSSTAFVLTNLPAGSSASDRKRLGAFIRLVDGTSEAEKTAGLTAALRIRARDVGFYWSSSEDFVAVPGSPIAYWLSEKLRATFLSHRPLRDTASLRQGLATANNSRFLRLWWEVSDRRTAYGCTSREEAVESRARWFPYNKGGEFRKWYGNQEHVVNWEGDGREISDFKPRSVIRNPDTYFSSSVSWAKVSSGLPAFRMYPPGFIYDVAGTSIFTPAGADQFPLLAFCNSQLARDQLAAVAPTLNYEVGQVALLPLADVVSESVVRLTAGAVGTAKADWDAFETSWCFQQSPLIQNPLHPY